MRIFFIVVFAVYGAMHAYGFFQARAAIRFGTGTGICLAVFMTMMTFAPVIVHQLERYQLELAARVFAYFAYIWMAMLFLFFCSSLAFQAVNLALRVPGLIAGKPSAYIIPGKILFFTALGLSAAISVYGYQSALNIRTERQVIETAKLPAGIDRFRIVQISDVHIGLIVRSHRLKQIAKIIRKEKPDLLVSTGDLVDAEINHLTGLAELLQEIRPPYGKFAITGNHEYYAGLRQALAFTKEAGFTLLRGETADIGIISIVGVDDPAGLRLGIDSPRPEAPLLTKLPKERFRLLLKHRPVIDERSAGMFDLQLSGHTHRGQIYPFTYISRLAYPLNSGRYDLSAGSLLYVSRGTGTWGPPVRFLSPPEVTVIDLVRRRA